MSVDLKKSETERISPLFLVPDEIQLVYQRNDGNVGAFEEIDITPIRAEIVAHPEWINIPVLQFSDGGEFLAFIWLSQGLFARIINDIVSLTHLSQRARLAVTGLGNAFRDTTLYMVFTGRYHPVACFVFHELLGCLKIPHLEGCECQLSHV